ncbi:amino acid ABC transporter substrate-binding protein [Pseudoalteromonas sp. SA25]|uniref:amino acid ABC transporter substrate-binding protein n=1 Tax=Pseudoalteromonas sp. SA25 TaxID=2686347 RepID=UPI0013FD34D4|nr:amino acid ABC transporter substrate-binding protein [Pseudoalteromonas sp. SA25]
MKILNQPLLQKATFLTCVLFSLAAEPFAHAQTLDRIQNSGTINLGFRTDDVPFSYRDDTGHAAGYAVALCKKVAEEVKSELRLNALAIDDVAVTTEDRFTALQSGKIDLLCGATTETIARRRDVSFSIPIFLSGIGVLTRVDAPSQLRALLAGNEPEFRPRWRASYSQILKQRTASVLSGTTTEAWVNDRIHEFGIIAKVSAVTSYDIGISSVLKGSSDMFFGDRAILLEAIKRNAPNSELQVIHRYFSNKVIALTLARDDEDFRLLVDRTLSRLYRTGEIDAIYTTYFGEIDATARGLFTRAALPE